MALAGEDGGDVGSWWRRGRERCSLFAKHVDREDPRFTKYLQDSHIGREDRGESNKPVNTAW